MERAKEKSAWYTWPIRIVVILIVFYLILMNGSRLLFLTLTHGAARDLEIVTALVEDGPSIRKMSTKTKTKYFIDVDKKKVYKYEEIHLDYPVIRSTQYKLVGSAEIDESDLELLKQIAENGVPDGADQGKMQINLHEYYVVFNTGKISGYIGRRNVNTRDIKQILNKFQ